MSISQAVAGQVRSRILVVDDEPHIRNVVTRALEAAGYGIDSAADGATGLELALTGEYQLVILDVVMPVRDGGQVLRQLRRLRPDQRVLVLSCLSDVTAKVDLLDAGAKDYLTKPFSLDELLARVRVQLRTEQQAADQATGDIVRAGRLLLDLGRMQ